MRLTLRKKLKPYDRLATLAEDLDMSIPSLKRRIRELDREGELSVRNLSADLDPDRELRGEGVFELFHQFGRCLVCGSEMRLPQRRDIGWGEFKQCVSCDFSTHELASYATRKQAAQEQLAALLAAARRTQQVLRDRNQQSRELREKQPLL